jgi:hypothetical protein
MRLQIAGFGQTCNLQCRIRDEETDALELRSRRGDALEARLGEMAWSGWPFGMIWRRWFGVRSWGEGTGKSWHAAAFHSWAAGVIMQSGTNTISSLFGMGNAMNTEPIQIVDRGRGLQLSTSRITVQDLVPYFQEGRSHDEILRWIPTLSRDEIAVVERYYRHHKEELDSERRRRRRSCPGRRGPCRRRTYSFFAFSRFSTSRPRPLLALDANSVGRSLAVIVRHSLKSSPSSS